MENKSFFNIKTATYTYRVKRVFLRDDEELRRYSVDMFLADLKAFEKKPNNYDYPDVNEFNKNFQNLILSLEKQATQ